MNWTPEEILFIDKLNAVLSEKEKLILQRVKNYLYDLSGKLKKEDEFTSEYEVGVEVSYWAGDAEEPFHAYVERYNEDILSGEETTGLIGDKEDWNESMGADSLPFPFTQRCCYLMHNLLFDSGCSLLITSINTIWIDIKIEDQHWFKIENQFIQENKSQSQFMNHAIMEESKPQVEKELFQKAFNGDQLAKEELITRNIASVAVIARMFRDRGGVNFDELLHAGTRALIKYVNRYPDDRYLAWHIRQSMIQLINKKNLL